MMKNRKPVKRTVRKPAVKPSVTDAVLAEVKAERGRQDARWGEQNHPLIGGAFKTRSRRLYAEDAEYWKRINDHRVATNTMGWDSIAAEELFETLEAKTLEEAREEAVQAAAVFVAMVESIDRKIAAEGARSEEHKSELPPPG